MKLKQKSAVTTISISILFTVLGMVYAVSILSASDTGTIRRCSSIPLGTAATILGVAPGDLHKSSSDLMVSPDDLEKKMYKIPPYQCTIRSKSNFLKLITYVIYVYNDPGQAQKEFKKMQSGFETVSKVDAVTGFGDDAFWAGDPRFQRLVAIKGGVVVDVLSPKALDFQKQIMVLVLENF